MFRAMIVFVLAAAAIYAMYRMYKTKDSQQEEVSTYFLEAPNHLRLLTLDEPKGPEGVVEEMKAEKDADEVTLEEAVAQPQINWNKMPAGYPLVWEQGDQQLVCIVHRDADPGSELLDVRVYGRRVSGIKTLRRSELRPTSITEIRDLFPPVGNGKRILEIIEQSYLQNTPSVIVGIPASGSSETA